MNEEKIQKIIKSVSLQFRTFGAGQETVGNPIANALKDRPPQFAVGVSVEDVVRFVLSQVDNRKPR